MKAILVSGFIVGVVLLILGVLALNVTIWLLPGVALEYFDPAFDSTSGKTALYYIHPFIMAMALSWFWSRFKGVLTGSFLNKGIEFGFIYVLIASLPVMVLIYSAMNISLAMVSSWFILALIQGVISGLMFEKLNP